MECCPRRSVSVSIFVSLPFSSFKLIDLSCAEMFIGVICACMSSFSKMFHYHDSQFQKWKTLFSSVFISLHSAWARIRDHMTSSDGKSTKAAAFYQSQTHTFVPLTDVMVSKVTSGGQRPELPEDVIHLRHDIRQEEYRM